MVARDSITTRGTTHLSEAVTPASPTVETWLQAAAHATSSLGGDTAAASRRALALLDGYVTHQAAVLAYNHVYQLITLSFFACLPLVLLLPKPQGKVEVEMRVD